MISNYKNDIDKWLESIQMNINEIIEDIKTSSPEEEDKLFKKIREQYHLIKLIIKIKEGKVSIKGFNHRLIKKDKQ